jgi:hypothetical protein
MRVIASGCVATGGTGVACSSGQTLSNIFAAGTYANLVKQAKSKQKILDKMYEAGLTQPVQKERTFEFQFPGACAAVEVLLAVMQQRLHAAPPSVDRLPDRAIGAPAREGTDCLKASATSVCHVYTI